VSVSVKRIPLGPMSVKTIDPVGLFPPERVPVSVSVGGDPVIGRVTVAGLALVNSVGEAAAGSSDVRSDGLASAAAGVVAGPDAGCGLGSGDGSGVAFGDGVVGGVETGIGDGSAVGFGVGVAAGADADRGVGAELDVGVEVGSGVAVGTGWGVAAVAGARDAAEGVGVGTADAALTGTARQRPSASVMSAISATPDVIVLRARLLIRCASPGQFGTPRRLSDTCFTRHEGGKRTFRHSYDR
jgi:hypothetical protein